MARLFSTLAWNEILSGSLEWSVRRQSWSHSEQMQRDRLCLAELKELKVNGHCLLGKRDPIMDPNKTHGVKLLLYCVVCDGCGILPSQSTTIQTLFVWLFIMQEILLCLFAKCTFTVGGKKKKKDYEKNSTVFSK